MMMGKPECTSDNDLVSQASLINMLELERSASFLFNSYSRHDLLINELIMIEYNDYIFSIYQGCVGCLCAHLVVKIT